MQSGGQESRTHSPTQQTAHTDARKTYTQMHVKHTTLCKICLPEDEPKKLETCSKKYKLI
jgi:hypothetical protein